MTKKLPIWLREYLKTVDWNLFVFLLLFLNVKLVIKLAGLIFIYLRRPNLRFRFSVYPPGISLFYPAVILLALINLFIHYLFTDKNYWILLVNGVAFWGVCILVLHQLILTVRQQPLQHIHNALVLFFLLNACVSLGRLLSIMIEIQELNPYRYQGLYQKYFIGTGDYIRGISFDTSTTNAVLNAMGVVYFMYRSKWLMSLLCMIILLLAGSNFTNMIIVVVLLLIFLFGSTRIQKSIIAIQLCCLVVFLTNVSPQNNAYGKVMAGRVWTEEKIAGAATASAVSIMELPEHLLTQEQKRYRLARRYLDSVEKVRQLSGTIPANTEQIVIPKVNIHAPEYQHRPDSSSARMQAIAFLHDMEQKKDISPAILDSPATRRAGKIIAFQQLWSFMNEHPYRWLTGAGMGNFSSKLAFRATGLKVAGGYPDRFVYINNDFLQNHLSVYLNYFVKDTGYHSIANSPNSVYGQLLGEYGLPGIIALLILYFRYFGKGIRRSGYGLPVLFILAGVFMSDYWFEQLSIVPVAELLLLLNREEAKNGLGHA
jgi:hypothetical protein